jgi:hypothetical protein
VAFEGSCNLMKRLVLPCLGVLLLGWALGFLSVIPVAYFRGHFDSQEILVGDIRVEAWNPASHDWELALEIPSDSDEGPDTRLLFTARRVCVHSPGPMFARLANDLWRISSGPRDSETWPPLYGPRLFGKLFVSSRYREQASSAFHSAPRQMYWQPKSIWPELGSAGFESEQQLVWMLLQTLDGISGGPATESAAIAVELGEPSLTVSVGRVDPTGQREFLFTPLTAREAGYLLARHYLRPGAYRMVMTSSFPGFPLGGLVFADEELSGYEAHFRNPWSQLFRREAVPRYVIVGGVSAVVVLGMFLTIRWRRGITRIVRHGAVVATVRAAAFDKSMSDPPARP